MIGVSANGKAIFVTSAGISACCSCTLLPTSMLSLSSPSTSVGRGSVLLRSPCPLDPFSFVFLFLTSNGGGSARTPSPLFRGLLLRFTSFTSFSWGILLGGPGLGAFFLGFFVTGLGASSGTSSSGG